MNLQERKNAFLDRLKVLYGAKYGLDRIYEEYVNMSSKVTIICPVHGEVKMKASVLLRGNGCKQCSLEKRLKTLSQKNKKKRQTTKEWVESCAKKHNGKYDYSLVNFEKIRKDGKVPIICHEIGEDGKEHGVFWQLPSQHKWGKGCKKCVLLTSSKIAERARLIHGDKYDYSLMKYKRIDEHVYVKCNTCGKIFPITPHNLLKGRGCPFCAVEDKIKKLQLPIDVVKKRINEVFGGKYNLDHIKYKNVDTPISLICPEHGEFMQTPYQLFSGHGCPKCGQSALENEIQVFLDENNIISEYEVNKKKFDWLNMQSLDFFLPEYNVAIECQGIQHFKPQTFGNVSIEDAQKKFKETVNLDNQKRILCEKNGIKLLYYSNLGIEYPYKVFEDKQDLLNDILKQKQNEQNY